MTWNSHCAVGLAQTIFYTIPLILAAILLFKKRHERPIVQWVVLQIFSIVRFVGGILFIIYNQNQSSVGWIVVAVIFEGAGVIPLLVSLMLHVRVAKKIDFPNSEHFRKGFIGTRLVLGIGIIAIVAGSALIGQYKQPNLVDIGSKLIKAGYIIVTFIVLVILIWSTVLLTAFGNQLSSASKKLLTAVIISIPFLIIRLTYALLSTFNASDKWSPLTGDIAPFVIMHSLMEYVIVLICIGFAFSADPLIPRRQRVRDSTQNTSIDSASKV